MPFYGTPNLKGRPKGSGHKQTFSQVVRNYLENKVDGKRPLDKIIAKLTEEKPEVLLHYGYGKPVESIELSGADGQPLFDPALVAAAAVVAKGL